MFDGVSYATCVLLLETFIKFVLLSSILVFPHFECRAARCTLRTGLKCTMKVNLQYRQMSMHGMHALCKLHRVSKSHFFIFFDLLYRF